MSSHHRGLPVAVSQEAIAPEAVVTLLDTSGAHLGPETSGVGGMYFAGA